jgi:hypothetical protein
MCNTTVRGQSVSCRELETTIIVTCLSNYQMGAEDWSFGSWLLLITSCRIADQFANASPGGPGEPSARGIAARAHADPARLGLLGQQWAEIQEAKRLHAELF